MGGAQQTHLRGACDADSRRPLTYLEDQAYRCRLIWCEIRDVSALHFGGVSPFKNLGQL